MDPGRRDSTEGERYFERDPGIDFKYSNEGIMFLQRALEAATGKDLEHLAREYVFEPLAMRDSSFVWRDDYERRKAVPHDAEGNPLAVSKPQAPWGPGGLHTTARDYAKFVAAMLADGQGMLEPQVEVHEVWDDGGPTGRDACWGLGWGLQAETFWHWGWNVGFLSFAAGWPATKRGVAVLTNGQNGLWLCKDVVTAFSGVVHPAFRWLGH